MRDLLDAQLDQPAAVSGDSLHSAVASPDAQPWEAALTAVLTVQVHVRVARTELVGGEETDEQPVADLPDADQLRQLFAQVAASLDAARQTLRQKTS
jgi:hypothetical protein